MHPCSINKINLELFLILFPSNHLRQCRSEFKTKQKITGASTLYHRTQRTSSLAVRQLGKPPDFIYTSRQQFNIVYLTVRTSRFSSKTKQTNNRTVFLLIYNKFVGYRVVWQVTAREIARFLQQDKGHCVIIPLWIYLFRSSGGKQVSIFEISLQWLCFKSCFVKKYSIKSVKIILKLSELFLSLCRLPFPSGFIFIVYFF